MSTIQIGKDFLSLLKQYNIFDVIIPENKNFEEIKLIKDDNSFRIHNIFDDRSAAYYAMGLAQRLRQPVVLITDDQSTTVADYLPGITEAFYQYVPILIAVFTKSNVNSVNNKKMKNAIEIIGDKCKFSTIINERTLQNYSEKINLLIKSILELSHRGSGPVYIEFIQSDLISDYKSKGLEKKVTRMYYSDIIQEYDSINELLQSSNILLTLDQNINYDLDTMRLIISFANKYNCIISKYDVYKVTQYYNNLLEDTTGKNSFDLILELGVGTEVFEKLENIIFSEKCRHWIIDSSGDFTNSLECLDTIVECPWLEFMSLFINDNEKINKIQPVVNRIKFDLDKWNMLAVAKEISNSVVEDTMFYNAGYDQLLFNQIFINNAKISSCNYSRAAGRDGLLSKFIGQATILNNTCICFINKSLFFRDMNALHIRHYGKNIIICLFKNLNAKSDTSAKSWGETCGFEYVLIKNKKELDKVIPKFLNKNSDAPILMEFII